MNSTLSSFLLTIQISTNTYTNNTNEYLKRGRPVSRRALNIRFNLYADLYGFAIRLLKSPHEKASSRGENGGRRLATAWGSAGGASIWFNEQLRAGDLSPDPPYVRQE